MQNIPLLAKKLRELRESKGWTREYLAAETKGNGIPSLSLRQIQRAEKGEKGVGLACYHRIAKALGTALDELLETSASDASDIKWNLPHPRNPFFTGRQEVIAQLRHSFTSKKTDSTQIQAISGLGGLGKTQTAVEYAYQYQNDYKTILWTQADSKENLTSSFASIAKLLNLTKPSEPSDQNQNLIVASVKYWLQTNADWFLIFDNADEPQLIEAFIPINPKGHILLTSRASVFQNLGVIHPIRLEKMTLSEAKEFLLKRSGHIGQKIDSLQLEELKAVERLAEELDYLPLALEQAAAYITQLESNFQNYLSSFQKRGLKLLEKTGTIVSNYPASVATTWELNFEQVEKESQAAANLLKISAFLHPEQIPFELFTLGAKEICPKLSKTVAKAKSDPVILDEVLEPLKRYSIVRRNLEASTYSIHRLVQMVIKERVCQKT